MIVSVDSHGAQLKEPEDLKGFKVVTATEMPASALAPALGGAGRLDGSHVWVSIAWLRDQASGQDPEWFEQFDKMLAYAGSKGWIDETGQAVRGHIEVAS